MKEQVTTLEITVHKSHLVTIGERLYSEGFELLRELVNNAYDADATEVRVTMTPDQVTVEDNGSGMDLEGLRQYFNIGSPEKRMRRTSPRFSRDRIGEFGIGKFASLSAARYFEVWTKQGSFQATVTFDRAAWEEAGASWSLPLRYESPDTQRPDGTWVILRQLTKTFDIAEVEARLTETVPIRAPNFSIFLNGKPLAARPVLGQRLPFLEGTPYGMVHGEIIVVPTSHASMVEAGIACRVKQVLVRREFFSIVSWGALAARIIGDAHADFLPLTSDRNDFVRDSAEYHAFQTVMESVIARVRPEVDRLVNLKESRRSGRILYDVLERLKEALIRNPACCPEALLPLAQETAPFGQPGYLPEPHERPVPTDQMSSEVPSAPPARTRKRARRPQVKALTPSAVIRRLKLGHQGLSCCIDHFGSDAPECYTEGGVVYLNRDHPLHDQFAQDRRAYTLYLARLLTQEIALMKQPRSPRQAFERQSCLLRDAFCDWE
jgi:hypothetical protein